MIDDYKYMYLYTPYIYKAYINTYTYNHQSYKAFRIGLYLRGLLFMC